MKHTLTTIAFVAISAMPTVTLAQGMDPAKMTCAEFTAMDKDGMMKAVETMHMAGPDASMMMDAAKTEETMTKVMANCDGKPDMMAMDAMTMK